MKNFHRKREKNHGNPSVGDVCTCSTASELFQGSRRIFVREAQLHWWVIGFSVEEKVYDGKYLTAKGTIEFPDEDFAEMFVNAANKKGVVSSRDGVNVSWCWAQGT